MSFLGAAVRAAAKAAKDVMDLGQYSLYQSGYGELFLTPQSNSEIIFARYYNINARHTALEIANGPNGYDGWGGNVPLQNLIDDYEMMDGTAFDWGNEEQASAPYENIELLRLSFRMVGIAKVDPPTGIQVRQDIT
mgnify:CR=1 FL=1